MARRRAPYGDRVVLDYDTLKLWVEDFLATDVFVFDVETRNPGGDPLDTQNNEVFWISFASRVGAFTVPLGHPRGEMIAEGYKEKEPWYDHDNPTKTGKPRKKWRTVTYPPVFDDPPDQIRPDRAWDALEPLLFSDLLKIGWNVPFDVKSVVKYYGGQIPPGPFWDGQVAEHILNENTPNKDLKATTARRFKFRYAELAKGGELDAKPFGDVARYSLYDAVYEWLCFRQQEGEIHDAGFDNIMDLDMDLTEALIHAEYAGARIDTDLLDELAGDLGHRMKEVKALIWREAGSEINLDSNDQVAWFVYEHRKHKIPAWTSGGKQGKPKPKTDEKALKPISKKDQHVARILEYSELSKMHGTYVEGIRKRLVGDHVHPNHRVATAVTGRLSCVAEDSLIEMPRDLVDYPDGVPITKVQAGDWVYAFDWKRELVLRQVRWVAQTGVRQTLIVTMENSEGHRLTLRVTPEHLVRLRNGDWRAAGNLMRKWGQPSRDAGPRVMTMVRRALNDEGYVRFFPHSVARKHGVFGGGKSLEHRWVFEQVTGKRTSTKADVHHRDGRKVNNAPENLEALAVGDHRGRRHIHPHWGVKDETPDFYQGPTDYHVVGVESGPVEPVWDMEVEGVHNFIANGVCVHNCAEPNLQNIPAPKNDIGKKIRAMFIAPEGCKLFVADYAQIEPRTLAHFSGDPEMLRIFRAGEDIYTGMGSRVYRKDQDAIEKAERDSMKVLVLSLMYGVGIGNIADQLGVKPDRAKELRKGFYKAFPTAYRWMQETVRKARFAKPPHTQTLLGRKRRLPELLWSDDDYRARAERQAVNHVIQGSAGEVMKVAFVRLHRMLPDDITVRLTVHDEVVGVVPSERTDEAVSLVSEAMTGPGIQEMLSVPMEVEVKIVDTWADAK